MIKILKINMLLIASVLVAFFVSSCGKETPKYIIGVSQCSEDSWRAKLQDELIMATYFNEGVELRFTSAHDDSQLQEKQIDSLVNSGIDLLIVSPNQVDNLTNAIGKAYAKKIPVVLYDRKTNNEQFTAFMGADNYHIGEMLGLYLAGKLGGKGNVVEIGGLKGSSPAQERHDGFANALKKYPEMQIVAYQSGDWTEASGETAMRMILKEYDGRIDAVYGGNDRMTVGARRVIKEHGMDNGNILYLGVDALPTENGGIRQVADSVLTASAIYPTHGDELLQLAIDVLEGKPVPKESFLKSSVVTSQNAKVLLLQHEEVVRQADYLRKMHSQASSMQEYINNQQVAIGVILTFILIIAILLGLSIHGYQTKHKLNRILEDKNQELEESQKKISEANQQLSVINSQLSVTNKQLMQEKEVAERQRDELEEQRDKIIEISLNQKSDDVEETGEDIINGNEKQFRRENEFLSKFLAAVDERLSNSDLSVEDIGDVMCLSRVQLYRKVKALTGKSPVEIIREERLKRGHQLLADSSLTISEIAYRVGFSSPSYFTKCYRDLFGKSPTEIMRNA
ncbi:MAG: substrate-binding domain-containing protein [Bacteroidaceae bacterium]|nr:substrate-binding domain-containing protein [Bacteroidaceae bacterium]